MFRESPLHKNAPLSAAVESDVVGYTTIEVKANEWYILGTPFTPLNDDTQTYTIDKLFSGATFSEGDLLYIVSKEGNFSPRYWNATHSGWSKSSRSWQEDTDVYPITSGIYLHPVNNGTVTFTGKVAAIEVEVGDVDGNTWDLTSMGYPVSEKLNNYEWKNFSAGDVLYRLNPTDGVFSPRYWNTTHSGWSKSSRSWQEDTDPLTIGQAVYIQKVSAGVGTISKR